MTGGYTGKILRVNLTTKAITTIDTAKYEAYGGGYGIGAAIFWDLAVAPGEWDLKDAFDPRNVVSLMTGPFGGTAVPGGGRTNISGVSPHSYPINQFYKGNMGGTWANTLKAAGWDGVVVEGKSDKPVWINIINDKVTIEDAKALWGLDTWDAQDSIFNMVTGRTRFGNEWEQRGDTYTTQMPAKFVQARLVRKCPGFLPLFTVAVPGSARVISVAYSVPRI
jgi:aldehyde:ferredoxin oxidoreductase